MNNWQALFAAEQQQPYYQQLQQRIEAERAAGKQIYPPQSQVFAAFEACPLAQVKVVILGQDPYHGEGQAHGLSFSVTQGVKIPPSLRNIYKELASDIEGFVIPDHGNLTAWAKQGVLLLNSVLTVEQAKAHSHAKWGWETFSDAVISAISQHCEGVVFLLWGAHAQKKGQLVESRKHHLLASVHPSPLSAHKGFFGCRHFSTANQLLQEQGKSAINWQL